MLLLTEDPEFAARGAELLEGNMKLFLLGGWIKLADLLGVDYRVTAEDTHGDGSSIKRMTWRNHPYNVPAKKSDAFKEYEYEMVRILDADGNVNTRAISELKSIYGEQLVILAPGLASPLNLLAHWQAMGAS